MEQTVPLSFMTWLIGFLVVLLGGCWGIFKYFEAQLKSTIKQSEEKLERVYARMDENKKSYYNDFVLLKVFKESNDARKEITDEKFVGLINLFNEKIDGLRSEVRILSSRPKDHVQ